MKINSYFSRIYSKTDKEINQENIIIKGPSISEINIKKKW